MPVAGFDFTLAFLSPEWPWKVRVGANSPSLWPTMFSVTNTGHELAAVVHREREADRVGNDRRAARPGLDDLLRLWSPDGVVDLLDEVVVDERAFLD